ncbi:hypothetical protein SDC9_161147 [bioreactor metagenome]|uniref:Uncharacterized protein n=1 Tax=bioreactor metagenome TaxID=1076179 RepID=A0A645FHH1_9ZZZZ
MLFTKGELQEYERMMREKPGFDRRPDEARKERDCPYCLYYDHSAKKCGFEACIVFQN